MAALRKRATLCLQNYFFLLQRASPKQSSLYRTETCSHHCNIPKFRQVPCLSTVLLNRHIHQYAQRHSFSTSTTIHKSKGFDMKKLQKYNIYDPQGNYIATSEIYNVEKFCDGHKKYTFEPMQGDRSSAAEAGLESVQIVEKPVKEHSQAHAEKTKYLNIKSAEAPWVVDKMKKMLLEHGEVLLHIKGKQTTSIRELLKKDWISKLCTISTVKEEERHVLLQVTMPTSIDSKIFKSIFLEYTAKDAAFLEQVKEFVLETAESKK